MSPKVSVVIPVFNALPYLHECLDTILAQTLQDIEVICVDDGSSDGSYEVLQRRSLSDSRVKVFNQNENAGAARNLGLENASGEYVLFLDADDFFDKNLCEHVYKRAIEKDADIVLFDGREYDHQLDEIREGTSFLRPLHLPKKDVFNVHDVPDHIFQISNPAPWSKLFRRKFLEDGNLKFQTIPNSNDVYLVFSAMAEAGRITTLDEDLLRYRVNTHSSTQDGKWRHPLCNLKAFSALESKLVDLGLYDEVESSFLLAVLRSIRYNLTTIKNRDARIEILGAIESGDYLRTKLIRDADEYPSSATRTRGLYLKAALEQRDIELVKDHDPETALVAERVNELAAKPKLSIVIVGAQSMDRFYTTIDAIGGKALSLERIEVILVSAGGFAKESRIDISEDFTRLRIVDVKQTDLSTALNAGLAMADGEYVILLEAGDRLLDDALDDIISKIESSRPDIVWIGASAKQKERAESLEARDGHEAIRELVSSHNFDPQLRNCVFRKDFAYSALKKDPFIFCSRPFRQGRAHSQIPFIFSLFANASCVILQNMYLEGQDESDSCQEAGLSLSKSCEDGFAECLGYALAADHCMKVLALGKTSWSSANLDAALRFVESIFSKAVSIYRDMPSYQRGGHVAIDELDEEIFKLHVSIPAQLLKKKEELSSARKKLKAAKPKKADSDIAQKQDSKPSSSNVSKSKKLARRIKRKLLS